MGRPKKQKAADMEHFSIKCGLGTIIRPPFRFALISLISQLSIQATNIAVLASLLLLYKVNWAMDNDNWYIFQHDPDDAVRDCFYAVLNQNRDNYLFMPQTFRQWVEQSVSNLFQWPSNNVFGNIFKYLYEQYTSNLKTNIQTHCEKRLKTFFKMCVYEMNDNILRHNLNAALFDHIDIRNAVNWTYNRRDTAGNDVNAQQRLEALLDELVLCGGPADGNVRDLVDNDDWFQSLGMWLSIQRAIENFHLSYAGVYNSWNLFHKYPLYVTRPTVPEPPTISNFTVIPRCTFQRRHIQIDTDALYRLLCKVKEVPRKFGKRKSFGNIEFGEFNKNQAGSWSLFFDMRKIVAMGKGKKVFDHQIISDGVSVTVLYLRPTQPEGEISNEELRRRYEAGTFWYELGIDPGMRTWNATVRRNVFTGEEANLKTSSKRYHYDTKNGVRKQRAERLTRLFSFEEESDRNETEERLGQMPSPRGSMWQHYIKHRLRMMERGIDTYTQRTYARLQLDKHIEWHRAIDLLAGKLVNHKPAIIFMGRVDMPANSSISIKKHVRCPGNRKLIEAFKKRNNCVVRLVDEYMTSQTCAKCFGRFDRKTKPYRYKLCANCQPDSRLMTLPTLIVTNVSKRALQMMRAIKKMWWQMSAAGNDVAAILAQSNTRRLVSKKQRFLNIWQPNANVNVGVEDAAQPQPLQHKTVWHRDICAAKLILYRGHCELFGFPVHPALLRP